jgi:hypothetical protein
VRRFVWENVGKTVLRGMGSDSGDSTIDDLPNGRFSQSLLRAQIGGPLRWRGGQVQPDSPAWEDLAGAMALQGILEDVESAVIHQPLRSSILDALLCISDENQLRD